MSYVKPQGLKLRDVSIVDMNDYSEVWQGYLCDVNILTVLKIEQDHMAWYHALLNQYFNQSTL